MRLPSLMADLVRRRVAVIELSQRLSGELQTDLGNLLHAAVDKSDAAAPRTG
jgi:hypothetical protein